MALDQLPWVAYTLLVISLIPVALTIPQFIKARRAPYYALRREALRRATRWALAALVIMALAIALLIVSPYLETVVSILTPTPTATATNTPAATSTPGPTLTPSITPTRRPTATPPAIPTPTPAIPVPEAALTPLPSAVPAREDALIVPVVLATEEDAEGLPVDPSEEFPPGDHRVYLFFHYEGMQDGVTTTFAWYREGEFIDFCSDTWLWGWVEGRDWGEEGRTSYFCKLPWGWDPGNYEIRIFIGTELQGIAQFRIAGAADE